MDLERAKEFYSKVFGWRMIERLGFSSDRILIDVRESFLPEGKMGWGRRGSP
jgi:predicted enzyme related to lactoylglutathione lyase